MTHLLHIDASPRGERSHSRRMTREFVQQWQQHHHKDAIAYRDVGRNALAVANPNSTEGATLWARYLTNWTFWNHVRTIAAFIAAALFTMTLNSPSKL